eukprot:scaffold2103_cov185-Amphora_coffeaeformis.AAC.11
MRFSAASMFSLTALLGQQVHGLAGQNLPTTTTTTGSSSLTDRRAMLAGLATTATAAAVTLGWMTRPVANAMEPSTMSLAAAEPGELQDVYFGVGCHEFVQAERDRLGRKDSELTSMAGYAGGTKTGEKGKVC